MARPRNLRISAKEVVLAVPLQPFVANSTKTQLLFAVPRHIDKPSGEDGLWPRYRIAQVAFVSRVVPVDADGNMLIDIRVRDASEGAEDVIVDDFSAEGLTANVISYATLAAETAEQERTLYAGDHVLAVLVNNSAGIDTNWTEGDALAILTLLPLDVPGESFGLSV